MSDVVDEFVEEERPGLGFWIGLALGTPVMVYGAYELVQQGGWPRALDVAKWLGGGLLLHDLVLVPIVLAVVWGIGRLAPPLLRNPLRAGVLESALIVAIGWPALRGYGYHPDNATIHPLDYGTAVLTALALLWAAVALWVLLAFLRRDRVRSTA